MRVFSSRPEVTIRRLVYGVVSLLLLMPAPVAVAQPDTAKPPRWSLGAGVLSAPRPYVGADAEVIPIPLMQFDGEKFFLQGLTAGYRFFRNERVSADVHLRPRLDGFENGDSPFLAGMDEPDPTLDLGIGMNVRLGRATLGLSIDADTLGKSDGVETRLSVGRAWVRKQGQVVLRPELGVSRQSGDLIDYYYGVETYYC